MTLDEASLARLVSRILERHGLIAGSAHALEILVVATIACLGTATFWHVLTIGSEE